jgi:hypothetical protein
VGLDGLTSIGGNLNLSKTGVSRLNGLEQLTHVDGDLKATAVDSMKALSSLLVVGGELAVPRFATDVDIVLLDSVGDLVVQGTQDLLTLEGLENLSTITGDLTINFNEELEDVTALHGLGTLGGDLVITNNGELGNSAARDLRDAIPSITGSVTISNN